MGLLPENFRSLMRDAGFRSGQPVELAEGAFGPPQPLAWTWRAPRKDFAPRTNQRGPRKPRKDAAGKGHGKGTGRDNRSKDSRAKGFKGKGGKPPKSAPPPRREPRGDGGQAFAGLADLLKKG